MDNFFTDDASANPITFGISDMLNQNWKDKTQKVIYKLIDMTIPKE